MSIKAETMTGEEAKLIMQQVLSFPLQGVCQVLKRIGGQWLDRRSYDGFASQVDGDKFICIDNIVDDSPCLIYSFGINHDWTFEDKMDQLNCTVHAYDHTIDAPQSRGQGIRFYKLGLGQGDNMDTLDNIITSNGHSQSTIQFLKVNIIINSTSGRRWGNNTCKSTYLSFCCTLTYFNLILSDYTTITIFS